MGKLPNGLRAYPRRKDMRLALAERDDHGGIATV